MATTLAVALFLVPATLCKGIQRAVWLDVAWLLAFEANSGIRAVVGVLLVVGPLSIGFWLDNHPGLRLGGFRLGLLPIVLVVLLIVLTLALIMSPFGLLRFPSIRRLLLFSGLVIGSLLWLCLRRLQEVAVHLTLAHILRHVLE